MSASHCIERDVMPQQGVNCVYPKCKAEATNTCSLCAEIACDKHSAPNVHYGPMVPIKREAA